jgi:hypothetical protein
MASHAFPAHATAASGRRPRRLAIIIAIVLLVAVAFAAGRALAPAPGQEITVISRSGGPQLQPGEDAVILVGGPFLAAVISDGLAAAPGPVRFEQVSSRVTPRGIAITARAAVEVLGVPVSAVMSTLVVPTARDDGAVAVTLSGTRAIGARLPGIVERIIEDTLNRELSEATRVDGFGVARIEMAEDAMLVYLAVDPSLLAP